MARFLLALLCGGALGAAGYAVHYYILAPRNLTPIMSQGSPFITAAVLGAVGFIIGLTIKRT